MNKISERLFILSFYEKRNNSIQISKSPLLSYGLLAGSLLDMVLLGVAEINAAKKFVVINPITSEKFLPGDLLKQILFEREAKKISFWIEALGKKRKRIEADCVDFLISSNILVNKKQLFHFHPEIANKPTIKYFIKEELRDMVLGGEEFELQKFLLLKILENIYMLDQVFAYDQIKSVRPQINGLISASDTQNEKMPHFESGMAIIDALEQVILNRKN